MLLPTIDPAAAGACAGMLGRSPLLAYVAITLVLMAGADREVYWVHLVCVSCVGVSYAAKRIYQVPTSLPASLPASLPVRCLWQVWIASSLAPMS